MTERAGYSGTSLVKKLGFAPGETIYVEDAPNWDSAFADDNGLELTPSLPAAHVHLFCDHRRQLEDFLKSNDLVDIKKSL